MVLLGAALLVSAAAAGEEMQPEGWAYELAGYLMSPYCPGRTLSDCPSPQAQDLRMWIIVQEAAGRSRPEVEEELYAQFGDVIRPAPKAKGFGLAAYAIPVLGFMAGGLLVVLFLRRQTSRGEEPAPPPPAPAPDAELERLVDEDLAR